jgi:hypothetical protein
MITAFIDLGKKRPAPEKNVVLGDWGVPLRTRPVENHLK